MRQNLNDSYTGRDETSHLRDTFAGLIDGSQKFTRDEIQLSGRDVAFIPTYN